MQREVLLPQVELTMESALIAKWLVRTGDRVSAQQPILEVETQKATSEVPSPVAGYVRELCVEEGQTVSEKALLCILTDTADEPFKSLLGACRESAKREVASAAVQPVAADAVDGPVKASPAARRIARELGVELSSVRGTGPGGRVTEEDVRSVHSTVPGKGAKIAAAEMNGAWLPMPATRLALIDQMQRSLAEIPQFHVRRRLNVTSLLVKSAGVTFTHRLVKSVAAALARHPVLRSVTDGRRVRAEPVNVAVAMDSPHGLVAPAVRNADRLSLTEIAAAINELRGKAEANRLQRAELKDAPFAISNLGMLGVDQFDAFVFHGQTAVLAVGRATSECSEPGTSSAWFSLAIDHRVVDGAEAARFLTALQEEILAS